MKRNKQKLQNVSSTDEKSDLVRPTSNFPSVSLEKYHIAEKTLPNLQVNHAKKKPIMKKVDAKENLGKTEFNFMVDLKTPIHKTSLEPKLLKLNEFLQNNQVDRTPKKIFDEVTKTFGLLFVSD